MHEIHFIFIPPVEHNSCLLRSVDQSKMMCTTFGVCFKFLTLLDNRYTKIRNLEKCQNFGCLNRIIGSQFRSVCTSSHSYFPFIFIFYFSRYKLSNIVTVGPGSAVPIHCFKLLCWS